MFEWDETKNKLNLEKHGISFEEASDVFDNPTFTVIDNRHDYGEVREISIGMIAKSIVVLVVHTDRNGDIRIISARKAKKTEKEKYYEYLEEALGED